MVQGQFDINFLRNNFFDMHQRQRKILQGYPFIEYEHDFMDGKQSLHKSHAYLEWIRKRRSVRDFSSQHVDIEIINNIIAAASSAPSGANKQPWTFCVVSNSELKKQIRIEAEKEEFESYNGRMSPEWLEDLKPLQTDWTKPFLENAPYLIVVFKKAYELNMDGSKRTNYYVLESVGIACGFLLTAIHNAGLCALTHTPSPMNFLSKLLKRPENERPFLLIPVGYPDENALVPEISKKPLNEVVAYY